MSLYISFKFRIEKSDVTRIIEDFMSTKNKIFDRGILKINISIIYKRILILPYKLKLSYT